MVQLTEFFENLISLFSESILQRLPTGKGTMKEVNTKFSLYLIAQLLYGTTLVFDRQVTLLELDVRAAYESCKRVGFLSTLDWEISDQRGFVPSDKKRIRRSKVTFPEKLYEIPRNPLHIISLDELIHNTVFNVADTHLVAPGTEFDQHIDENISKYALINFYKIIVVDKSMLSVVKKSIYIYRKLEIFFHLSLPIGFSKECRELYRSKKHIPMTYEDAAMLNLLEPINRGNDCELWRFDGSQDKSSKDLTDLQDCKANEDELHGIAFILETPERIKQAERSRSKSMSINEDGVFNNIISQMDLIQVEENLSILSTEGRDSRASNLEQARRGTYTDRYSCLDGRQSSALFDPLPNSSIYGAASIFDHHPGRCSLPSEYFEDLSAARYRIEIALQRGGVIPLTQIIQPLTTSRKSAANIFATLLDMIKLKKVEVEQLTPYEEIWMWSASLKAN
uniref:General transcription factor 3C polypeptide 1 n=1 Tax=Heterorhabditis bacteriophora TaxID=37862 RepID=A0A1I7XHA8_HETBA